MRRARRIIGVGAVTAAVLGGGTAIAVSSGGDGDREAAGAGADRARAAALELTGGGTANAVERVSENGATWEVEVTRPGGGQVDVRLDADFRLVVVEADGEDE